MYESTIIQRALLTVFDKTGIVKLAEQLHLKGVELISTGQTASLLKSHGLPVITVSEYTGFPEIMHGRVKTLHPKIHGGILGRRDHDIEVMEQHQIPDIDLVVVNLYPFREVIQKPNVASMPKILKRLFLVLEKSIGIMRQVALGSELIPIFTAVTACRPIMIRSLLN